MYRQPIDTGHRISPEPTICSVLMGRIGWKCPRKSTGNEQRQKPSKHQGTNQYEQHSSINNRQKLKENETNKSNDKEPKLHVRRLQKITVILPVALQSNDAYEEGLANCETCTMTRNDYKQEMQAIRVTEIVVDGVIEKEHMQAIEDGLCEDLSEKGEHKIVKREHSKSKSEKVLCKFEIYCESKEIKHNLKCVLVNLQRSLSNVIVQICFVKSRKLTNVDKYRKFDISINDLKVLKFECSNLTDKIIQLFKSPLENKNYDSGDLCIACIKEKLSYYNDMLDEVLKSGYNLKVIMRNEGFPHTIGHCCQRTYSHIHAEVQGKPVVLKYTMPFKITDPPEKNKNKRSSTSSADNQPDDLPKKKKKNINFDEDNSYQTPFNTPNSLSEHDIKGLPKPPASKETYSPSPSETDDSKDDFPPKTPFNVLPKRATDSPRQNPTGISPQVLLHGIPQTQSGDPLQTSFHSPIPKSSIPEAPQKPSDGSANKPFDTQFTSQEPHKTSSDSSLQWPDDHFVANEDPTQKLTDDNPKIPSNDSLQTEDDNFSLKSTVNPLQLSSEAPLQTPSNGSLRQTIDNPPPIQFDETFQILPEDPPQKPLNDNPQISSDDSPQTQHDNPSQNLTDNPLQLSPEGPPQTSSQVPFKNPSKISRDIPPHILTNDNIQKVSDNPLQTSLPKIPSDDSPQKPAGDPPTKTPSSSFISSNNSFLDDTFGDDVSETFKDKKKKQVSFAKHNKETTVLPLLINQPTAQLSPPSSNYTKNMKEEDTEKIPFGTVTDHVPIYLAAVDSVVVTKHRLSHSESYHKKSISDVYSQYGAHKQFTHELDNEINNNKADKSIIQSNIISNTMNEVNKNKTDKSVIQGNIISNTANIIHQNKKVENFLQYLGKDSLLFVSSPADCCKTDCLLVGYKSESDLPLSASLDSLPLDHNDLKYIAKASGKHISHEDIMLLPEDEILGKEYKWEMEFENDEEPEKTKWTRALAGSEISSEQCKEGKKVNIKNSTVREDSQLPTIKEEETPLSDDGRTFHVESALSLPLQVKQKHKTVKTKTHITTIKQRTTELRYFTVEFPNLILVNKLNEENNGNINIKSNNNNPSHEERLNLEKKVSMGRSVQILKEEIKKQGSSESFHSCCSSVSDISVELFNSKIDDTKTNPKQLELNAEDEMIMLNAIYVCGSEEDKYVTSSCKSFKNDFYQSSNEDLPILSPVENFNCLKNAHNIQVNRFASKISCKATNNNLKNKSNFNLKPHFMEGNIIASNQYQVRQKQSYITSKNPDKEIDSSNPQVLQSCSNKNTCSSQEPNFNKSHTITKRSCNKLSYSDDSTTNRILCTQYEMETNNVMSIQNHQPHENIGSCPLSKSIKKNKSYTVVKGKNQNIDLNIGTLQIPTIVGNPIQNHKDVVKKRSYTIFKNLMNQPDITPQKLQTEKDVYCGTKQAKNCIKSAKVMKNNNCTRQGNWSKLNIHNVNVINYINHQKSIAELKKQKKTNESVWNNYREFKKIHYFPSISNLNYSFSKCRFYVPELKFATLSPIVTENRIIYMIYKSNTADVNIYEISEANNPEKHFEPLIITNKQKIKSQSNIENHLGKSYISVKNHLAQANKAEKISSNKDKCLPIRNNQTEKSVKVKDMPSSRHNFTTRIIKEEVSNINTTTIWDSDLKDNSLSCTTQQSCASQPSIANCETQSCSKSHNPCYVYDNHGRPLTDNSGQPLHNLKGKLLLIYNDKSGLPMCDIDNNQIFDSSGFTVNDDDFNPTKPYPVNILKNFTTIEGKPMVLYDFDGKPLTSASGTMLVDSSGLGLIRFSSTGNPVSDYRGKPIYSINGLQFITDTK